MAEIKMVIDSIRVSRMNYQRVVILKEKDGERYLHCWIDHAEAESIAAKLQGIAVSRPLTLDFTCSIIDTLGASVMCAVINKLENDTLYAKIRLESDGKIIEIDCRPSDAIGVAIRTSAPIFADEKVLNKTSVLIDPLTGEPLGEQMTSAEEVMPGKQNTLLWNNLDES